MAASAPAAAGGAPPYAGPRDASIAGGVRAFRYQPYYPGSDLELEQGEGLDALPESIRALMRSPMVPQTRHVDLIVNGNEASFFPVTVGVAQAIQALIMNPRRSYLAVQNLGPGNLWLNFSQVAVVNQCLQIVPSAFYEPIPTGPLAGDKSAIVPPRSAVWLIADGGGATAMVAEGSWMS